MAQSLSNRSRLLEKFIPVVRQDGLNTNKNVNIGINSATANLWVSGAATVGGSLTTTGALYSTAANGIQNAVISSHTPTAINATATATAAQVATGYITSTSAAATTITLPTGSALGPTLAASQGTVFDLWIDNTAGANTVTIAVNTNATLNALATAVGASFGLLTVPSGATGQARFTLTFSAPTVYTFARTA